MRKKEFKLAGIITLLCTCSLIISSCSSKEEDESAEKPCTPVKITNPVIAGMTSTVDLNAVTVFLKKEVVRGAFAGYIQKAYKNIGDPVKEGEVLFQMVTKEAYAIDQENNKSFVSLKAKSNGVLTQLNYHPGDFVSEGEQIALISNPNSMAVMVNVPYQNLGGVKTGTSCKIFLPDGKSISGKIAKSMPSIDAASQTQSFIVECGGISNLPENLNLRVQIVSGSASNAVTLPKSCILSDETLTEFWVMKLINDSTAIKVPVVRGLDNGTHIQILKPQLSKEDKIVLEGAYGLADTAKVNIER